MKQFLVYIDKYTVSAEGFDENLLIVNAKSKQEAIDKFLINFINKKNIEIKNRLVQLFTQPYIKEVHKVVPLYSIERFHEHSKIDIKCFFEGTDYADIFIEYCFGDRKNQELPIELLMYCFKKASILSGKIIVKPVENITLNE